ncbi:ion transporter [Winogradskyella sp. PG-2]|uniref:ion transporter n=1 Tax=Winogradskyella sp. PG-2 TaxID=754409 RepID=UPI0004587D4A|nr:ion transporter [Winogradskyella sp. PG-2]BAO77725.1 potassium voltage-gated channel subfamily KQT [Winogradskyella sp. PG-2]
MESQNKHTWKTKLHEIIYEADTPAGKLFDVILLIVIIASIVLVMLESVDSIDKNYHNILISSEWIITILFSLEYIARVITVKKPIKYITSFYGIIDLLSTIPMYLSFFFVSSGSFVAFRALRLLRVFRILKLTRYIGASTQFVRALKTSRAKIAVFLSFVIILCIILGTVMYLVESEKGSGFTSIPRSVYWAIVTLTTVGYGDIAPATPLGQFIASIIMIMGYGIIAVPTGIVSSEMTKANRDNVPTNTQSCLNCLASNHRDDSQFCHKCGHELHHD